MAATNLFRSKISESKFQNWLKAKLGLSIVKEGITPFVCDEFEQFQQKCLSDICNNNGLPAGSTCSNCCTENVVVCPTKRLCHVGRGRCTFHRDYATQYIPSGCPGKICHNFKKEIQNAYRYYGPSYRNTDATQWCSNLWELVKCFMPPDGYKHVGSAADTDFNGIISVIISFKDFQSKVHADLSKANNIFIQAREVGRDVRHSPNSEIEDEDLQRYFTILQTLLSDPAYVASDAAAQNAKQKLQQLLNSTLDNTEDEVRKLIMENDATTDVINNRHDQSPLRKKLETKRSRPATNACVFDGRLIKFEENEISYLDENYKMLIGKGSCGMVYSTADSSVYKDFGIRIALKKISLGGNGTINRTVRREMVASRIMHPFVLPLLAVIHFPKGNPEIWLVSPMCEKGDLGTAIEAGILKTTRTRVKILLHIALAIQYIHTEVKNVRDVILHKDIASKNVVLDAHFNARLIDFGLAREKEDTTGTASGRVHYSHPYVGAESATESWDYFSFAVIIREMLTSLGPEGGNGRFLKFMKPEEILGKLHEEVRTNIRVATKLNGIALACLENLEMGLPEFQKEVVEGIKDIWWKELNQGKIINIPDGNTKCHICMINPKATETSMTKDHRANCSQKIEACIACEKNSFLNPIKCYCDTVLKPVIGCRCGALLVSGNDQKNPLVGEALAKDILMLEKLITSLAPRIMGISKDKVHTVIPSRTGKPGEEPEQLWPKVKDCINAFSKETELDTLLVFFSCHGAKEVGQGDGENNNFLQLGSVSDSISVAEFETELEKLGNIDKLVIILDCCYPDKLQFKKKDRKFIQINACNSDEQAVIGNEGSIFTKYLIQGLKACSEEKICPDDCQHCERYWKRSTDFISATSLYEYVRNHMDKGPQPVLHAQTYWSNIAFYTDEKVVIDFTCDGQEREVSLEYLQEMKALEEKVFEVFGRDKDQFKVRIQKDTYRMENRFLDCNTLEKVMSAWVQRQPLKVVFEKSDISTENDMETNTEVQILYSRHGF